MSVTHSELPTRSSAAAQAQASMQDSLVSYMQEVGQHARQAARELAVCPTSKKNEALNAIADEILRAQDNLIEHNKNDLDAAKENNIAAAMLDRLELTPKRIESMAEGLRQVARLPDPVGAESGSSTQASGLKVAKMRVPLGVIGMIYESRPNVTADAAALCLKSGNAVILRGGSEAIHSNRAIAACIDQGLRTAKIAEHAVQLVDSTDRAAVGMLLTMQDTVDVIIPRGGKGLVARISQEAKVPVIKHLEGICHVYIDATVDIDMAVAVAVNSKTYRYGICGAMETLLVHEDAADKALKKIHAEFMQHGVEVRGCDRTQQLLPGVAKASEDDWHTEYLAPIVSVRVVDDFAQAVDHIAQYGSGHTDAIITNSLQNATRFQRMVDSSSVMVNAATCFADGFEYGLGAEIGISTDKLHVRGPVGLEGLTTEKYIVTGNGTIRT